MTQKPNPSGPLTIDPEELAELERRWAAIEAGEATVPHDEVVLWLETWGTPAFRPWLDQ
jgi:predicted transcriptional regulator